MIRIAPAGAIRVPSLALAALAVLAVIAVLAPPLSAQQSASERLHRLFEDAWEFELRENPLFATRIGDHRYNDRLPSVTLEDWSRRLERERELLDRVRAIDRDALDPDDRVDRDIFERLHADRVAEYELGGHLIPITNREGFHVSFPQLPDQVPLRSVRDYENYIARLNGFHEYARQHIGLMREGVARGYTLPRVTLEGYHEAIEPHIVEDPTESLLHAPFESFPEAIGPADRERLTRMGVAAITGSVVPGYREFLAFMRDEYVPAARDAIGASALPEGRAFYEHRVRRFTTLDLTPEQVHRTGHAEVERIRAEMQEVLAAAEFDGTLAEFIEFLRTDPQFYVDDKEELLRRTAFVLKRMDGELPRLFGRLPRMSYGIREVPAFIAPRTTTAYYERPAGDGTKAGFYYVNTYDLPSRPLYEIEALSLHEAVPGHHLQIALQQEIEGLPAFRRFFGFTAFTEGWALYAERLGREVGFYRDPYSDFGRLTYEMWRACRLVVDPGLHYLGWTRERAIEFMAENTALTLLNIRNEVDRYIAWPGQAVAYKTGELKIRELRERAARELGARFDLRAFHDVVLGSGAVPLDVLERNVVAHIEAVAGGATR